jgi:hypothetical protein
MGDDAPPENQRDGLLKEAERCRAREKTAE